MRSVCVQRLAVLSIRHPKMSKLSFRARALDPTKPMPIYLAEELPDLPEYSAINRAVPQMPSGMEKEEESVSFALFSSHHIFASPWRPFFREQTRFARRHLACRSVFCLTFFGKRKINKFKLLLCFGGNRLVMQLFDFRHKIHNSHRCELVGSQIDQFIYDINLSTFGNVNNSHI